MVGASTHVKWKVKEHGRQGRELGRPCKVQQSLENFKRVSIEQFHGKFILPDWKPHIKGCFAPEQTETAVAQLSVVSTKVSLRWRLKNPRLWQVNATVKYVVGRDDKYFCEVGDKWYRKAL